LPPALGGAHENRLQVAECSHELRKVGAARNDLVHATNNTGQVGKHNVLETILGIALELASQFRGVTDEQDLFDRVEWNGGRQVAQFVWVQVVDEDVDEALGESLPSGCFMPSVTEMPMGFVVMRPATAE